MYEANITFRDKNGLVYKFRAAQSIIGMVLNTIAWLVILRTKNLRNMTNYLMAYLAVVDSIYCFSILFDNVNLGTIAPVTYIGREIYCRIIESYFASSLPSYSSIYALCLVTYERYIGIVHPLHYPRMMSAKRVSVIILLSWMMAILFASPFLFTSAAATETDIVCDINFDFSNGFLIMPDILFAIFSYLLPIVFMGWAYYKIQATLKKSAQQLQQQNVQGAALELLQARQKVIHMLMIVMGALVVFWTPATMLGIFCLLSQNETICYSDNGQIITALLYILFHMNSVINPIIYVFKYKKFQKGLQDMLCCCIGRPHRPNQVGVQITGNDQIP